MSLAAAVPPAPPWVVMKTSVKSAASPAASPAGACSDPGRALAGVLDIHDAYRTIPDAEGGFNPWDDSDLAVSGRGALCGGYPDRACAGIRRRHDAGNDSDRTVSRGRPPGRIASDYAHHIIPSKVE